MAKTEMTKQPNKKSGSRKSGLGKYVISKIQKPNYSQLLTRQRLFDDLDKARGKPVTWVISPPGSGKTSLLSSYVENRGIPCLWYRIDEEDMDVAGFYHHMGMAVKNMVPRSRKKLPHLAPEYMLSLTSFSLKFFETVYALMPRPGLIVFDSYQNLPENSPMHKVLANIFDRMPEDMNVMVLSREEPPADYATLRSKNLMSFLDFDSIRFTKEETADFIGLVREKGLRQGVLERLYEKTNGWIAGLVLITEHSRIHDLREGEINKVKKDTLFDYFANEILVYMEIEDQEILVASAFLEKMTSLGVERVTGSEYAIEVVKSLNRKNYFVSTSEGRRSSYQYHPLFKEFLLSRSSSYFSEEKIIDIKLQASKVLLDEENHEDAWRILVDIRRWDLLRESLLNNAERFVMQGRVHGLGGWISCFPETEIEDESWLLYWRGACRMYLEPGLAENDFRKSYAIFKQQEDVDGLYLSWCSAMECVLLQLKGEEILNHWLDELDHLRQLYDIYPSVEIEARVSYCAASSMIHLRPDHPEFINWMYRAVELLPLLPGTNAKLKAMAELGYKNTWLGDYVLARRLIGDAQRLASKSDAAPVLKVMLLTFSAIINWGDVSSKKEWSRSIGEAWKSQGEMDLPIWGPFLLVCSIFGNLIDGNMSDAEEMTERLWDLSLGGEMADPIMMHAPALLAYFKGEYISALGYAEVTLKNSAKGNFFIEAMCLLLVAQLNYELGRKDDAWRLFNSGKRIAEKMRSRSLKDVFMLFEARMYLEDGQRTEGLLSLKASLELNKEMGGPCTPYVTRDVITNLYVTALSENIEVDYVCTLIKRRRLVPKSPPIEIEQWPWLIKIYTLGRFSILKDDKPVVVSRKTPRKCMELLKSIISLGSRDVSLGRLASILWRDMEGDMALQSLKVTIHRVRKLLENDDVLIVKDGQISLNSNVCWVDVWAFERISKYTDNIVVESSDSGLVEKHASKLLNLYQGAYLEREQELPVMLILREKLRDIFLRKIIRIADFYLEQGLIDKAVDYCTMAIDVNPVSEKLYQKLMLCYMRSNRVSDALASYDRCSRILQSSFGIKPSIETETIRSDLIRMGG